MKHLLLTTIAAVVLVGNVLADSIHDVVRFRNIEAVKQAITDGADVNSKDGVGRTPFFIAVEYGKKEAADFLIAKGADVNVRYRFELSPLDLAVKKGRKEFVELLISKGADVNAKQPKSGKTALHLASSYGQMENAGLLISAGADANAKDSTDRTPLDAVLWGFGFSPSARLKAAASNPIVGRLRKHGGKTGAELNVVNSIHAAASAGQIEAIKQHLTAGADVNAKEPKSGKTSLHLSSLYGNKEIAGLLISASGDVNAKDSADKTPLDAAIGFSGSSKATKNPGLISGGLL